MLNVVIYHDNCADGLTAAACFKNALIDCEFLPATYDTFEQVDVSRMAGASVYFVDFSPSYSKLLAIAAVAKSVVVLDHHKTAQAALTTALPEDVNNVKVIFDMGHSGAALAWRYLYPDKLEPALVAYVEDRDLWHFKLPDSKAVSEYLSSFPRTVDSYLTLLQESMTQWDFVAQAAVSGSILLRKLEATVHENLSRMSYELRADPNGACYVAIGNVCTAISETAKAALDKWPIVTYSETYMDKCSAGCVTRVYSLRSRGDFDVSEVAKRNGGGGHPAAAGYSVKVNRAD